MIQVYTNPTMLDFLRCAAEMPAGERAQFEASSGEPYDVDAAAVSAYCSPGPKWVIKDEDGTPIVAGGFVPQRKGVWRDFLLTTPLAWEKHGKAVTRQCRKAMDAMLRSGEAHRLECVALASRTDVFRWYKVMGYHKEGTLYGYYANGADAVIFSRVKH